MPAKIYVTLKVKTETIPEIPVLTPHRVLCPPPPVWLKLYPSWTPSRECPGE